MVRNPKDFIVSYFHHHKLIHFHKFTQDINKFAEYFMDDQCKFEQFEKYLLILIMHNLM